jgi:hypothetical protein
VLRIGHWELGKLFWCSMEETRDVLITATKMKGEIQLHRLPMPVRDRYLPKFDRI